ncbi:MAG: gamma-glutamylcyclotransferase family protein [Bacteroidota bacterium]
MYIFVYGTLLTSIPSSMSKFLRRRGQLIGKATVSGTLYDLGMYPGYVAGEEGRVKGELYRLNPETVEMTVDMLDAYESVTGAPEDEYRKIEVMAKVNDGGSFKAFTYEFTKSVAGKAVIPLGDYAAFYPGNEAHGRFVNGE